MITILYWLPTFAAATAALALILAAFWERFSRSWLFPLIVAVAVAVGTLAVAVNIYTGLMGILAGLAYLALWFMGMPVLVIGIWFTQRR
jgi:hypothetical protein